MAANLLLCLADWLFVDGYFICTLKCHSGLHSLWNLTTPSVLCFVQGLMTHEDAGTNLDACPFNRRKIELAHQALCEVSLIEMHWCRRLFSNLLLEKIIFMSFWADLFIMCTSPSRSELRAVCSLAMRFDLMFVFGVDSPWATQRICLDRFYIFAFSSNFVALFVVSVV